MNGAPDIIALGEHKGSIKIDFESSHNEYYFKNQKIGKHNSVNKPCFIIEEDTLRSHYYIGLDWLCREQNKVVYITPKLNKDGFETDYLSMLLACLNDTEASKNLSRIYEIKNEEQSIEIDQDIDLLSPILAIQFLHVVKALVKKGLRKSYYREQNHLNGKVKGKLLVSQTLKHYTFQNKPTNTVCEYDTFGINHSENQVLKAALEFVKAYLSKHPPYFKMANDILNFCLSAFHDVEVPKNVTQFQNLKVSPFFKAYKEAIDLAKVILKRFGYNIRSIESRKIKIKPFWIDMPLLFELYAYTFLRKNYKDKVHYQYKSDYQELDFLINAEDCKMVVDAKYKTKYGFGGKNKEDIRQLAGYARMENVYNTLHKKREEVIDCLIVYPIKNWTNVEAELDMRHKQPISNYVGFYSLGLNIPRRTIGLISNLFK